METPESGPLQLRTVRRFVDVATDALLAAREEIDALNVYPVPDGDTGTNMFLTFSSAREALATAVETTPAIGLEEALAVFARGALLGARGNSGVILSEMLGSFARRLAAAAPTDPRARVMAQAIIDAADGAYRAVGTPVEGTILTVARAAAEAVTPYAGERPSGPAEATPTPTSHTRDVFAAAARAARLALERTPDLLPVLAEAGVVDAGGRGLVVVLNAAERVFTGRRDVSDPIGLGARAIPIPRPPTDSARQGPGSPVSSPGFEVMYLLEAPDDAIGRLRAGLEPLGDSLVVVGGEGLWNVHVHVDDVGAAVERGVEVGRPHRIRVTHLREQIEQAAANAASGVPVSRTGRAVVAVAAGAGLADLYRDAGAVVLAGGPAHRPSTGELLEAITGCGAAEVIVLPNDADSLRAAEIAARLAQQDCGVSAAVLPTRAQVQGLAALAVHEPGRDFAQDVLEMTATARHARHGAVTTAAKRAMTMAGPCEIGDALGVIDGDFVVVGQDLPTVAVDIVDRLLGGGGELVTLVTGSGGGDITAHLVRHLQQRHTSVDTVVYDGGQARYPVLIGVE